MVVTFISVDQLGNRQIATRLVKIDEKTRAPAVYTFDKAVLRCGPSVSPHIFLGRGLAALKILLAGESGRSEIMVVIEEKNERITTVSMHFCQSK